MDKCNPWIYDITINIKTKANFPKKYCKTCSCKSPGGLIRAWGALNLSLAKDIGGLLNERGLLDERLR